MAGWMTISSTGLALQSMGGQIGSNGMDECSSTNRMTHLCATRQTGRGGRDGGGFFFRWLPAVHSSVRSLLLVYFCDMHVAYMHVCTSGPVAGPRTARGRARGQGRAVDGFALDGFFAGAPIHEHPSSHSREMAFRISPISLPLTLLPRLFIRWTGQ